MNKWVFRLNDARYAHDVLRYRYLTEYRILPPPGSYDQQLLKQQVMNARKRVELILFLSDLLGHNHD